MMTETTHRHTHWFTTAAFSTIALVSITTEIGKITDQDKAIKWSVSGVSISLALSGLAVFANLLLKEKFIGTLMEGGLAVLTCGFWAACLPAIMDPDNLLAVRGIDRGINNANLYFFSWGAFLMSFFVLFGFMKEFRASNTEGTNNNSTRCEPWSWAALLTTSFVMMIASSRIFDDMNCDQDLKNNLLDDMCKRIKFGVSLGAVSSLTSVVWIFLGMLMKGRIGTIIDFFLAWLMFTFWVFGIGYLTFGDKAPAKTLGNLYFFIWASFCISVAMAMTSLKNALSGGSDNTTTPPKEEMKKNEVPSQEEPVMAADEETGMSGEMAA